MLNPKALGYTLSVLAAGFWLLVMTFSLLTGIGRITLDTIGHFHPFFSYSWGGMVIIVIEHLVFGFIVGWLFARVYNRFNK